MAAVTLPAGFKYTAAFMAGRPIHRDDHFAFLHPRMDRRRRAKLFAPFDALDGYSASIDSKNIEYVERVDLEEDDRTELNRRIRILRGLTYNGRMARANRVQVTVRYYIPCTDEDNFAFRLRGIFRYPPFPMFKRRARNTALGAIGADLARCDSPPFGGFINRCEMHLMISLRRFIYPAKEVYEAFRLSSDSL